MTSKYTNKIYLTVILVFTLTVIVRIHPFLAINKTVNGEILVVEAWISKYALQETKRIFEAGNYKLIATVGIASKDYNITNKSEKAATYFEKNGIDKKKILVIVAEYTTTNKTRSCAFELKKQIQLSSEKIYRIDVLTFGAHARKSYVVYKNIFEPEVEVGIISIRPNTYNPGLWWLSIEGWKWVIFDSIKYLMALARSQYTFRLT